jgi:hypothetical protein
MEIPSELLALMQGGGTPALALLCYFIYKLESRLARIEKAFDTFVTMFTKGQQP